MRGKRSRSTVDIESEGVGVLEGMRDWEGNPEALVTISEGGRSCETRSNCDTCSGTEEDRAVSGVADVEGRGVVVLEQSKRAQAIDAWNFGSP